MQSKAILAIAIIISCFAGGITTYFLMPAFSKVGIPGEVEAAASAVKVVVMDNGLEYTFTINNPIVRVIFWQVGGKLLAEDVWVDGDWQIVLGGEDKPTSDMKGDMADIILKVTKPTGGPIWFEVFCGGDYNKRIYFNNVLKLDTSSGVRRARW